jgi:plastocyanin
MRLSGPTLCALLLAACGGGGGGTPPQATPASISIVMSPTGTMSSIGDSRTLTATVRDASQAVIPGAAVTWSTDNQAVATLNSTSGLTTTATGAGNGTATITARSGTVSQTQGVSVAQVLSTVTLAPTSFQLAIDQTQQLTATARDARNNAISGASGFTFSSSNEAAATVSASGLVRRVGTGAATFTASLDRDGVTKTATASLIIAPATATVNATPSSTFVPPEVSITSGGTVSWAFGSLEHNVNFDAVPGAPANIPTSSNETLSRTFNTAGTFPYHCNLHAGMNGSVTVH